MTALVASIIAGLKREKAGQATIFSKRDKSHIFFKTASGAAQRGDCYHLCTSSRPYFIQFECAVLWRIWSRKVIKDATLKLRMDHAHNSLTRAVPVAIISSLHGPCAKTHQSQALWVASWIMYEYETLLTLDPSDAEHGQDCSKLSTNGPCTTVPHISPHGPC